METKLNIIGNVCRLTLLILMVTMANLVHAATINVINLDSAGEGFNDTRPADPDSTRGGNSGSNLGAQRLRAFRFAANIWSEILVSPVAIEVGANFDSLLCDSTRAVLGSAGPSSLHWNFGGAPVPGTMYVQALANALSGIDLDPAQHDISAQFNSSLGTTCPFPKVWYYGLDGNTPSGKIDFVTVVMHELAHGLGFISTVDPATGQKFIDRDDAYMRLLENHATQKMFPNMSDAERLSAATSGVNLHWTGSNAINCGGTLSAGRHNATGHIEMYAPSPLEPGSSVSHFSTSLSPDQLMEPIYTSSMLEPDIDACLLADLGWTVHPPNIAPIAVAGSNQNVVTGSLVRLDGSLSNDPDNGPSPLTYRWSQSSGPSVMLSGDTGIRPTFTPTQSGTYIFSLVVNDGAVNSPADFVTINASGQIAPNNQPPIANAGDDQNVNAGKQVTLNGSASRDLDNRPSKLTYHWRQTRGPSITLSNDNASIAKFTALLPGTYQFQLIVYDGAASSGDLVVVTVKDTNYVLIQSPNGGEIWNEKSNHAVSWLSRGIVNNQKLNLYLSTDQGATWQKIAKSKNRGAKNWKVPQNKFVTKQALIKLCVKPSETICDVSDAVFTINKIPTADAGIKQKVAVNSEVILDGENSNDPDHGPSTLNFKWIQLKGPKVNLIHSNSVKPSFKATRKGVYKFALIVNDGAADSKRDKVSVKVVGAQ